MLMLWVALADVDENVVSYFVLLATNRKKY